jgi:hypothetical protein
MIVLHEFYQVTTMYPVLFAQVCSEKKKLLRATVLCALNYYCESLITYLDKLLDLRRPQPRADLNIYIRLLTFSLVILKTK